MPIASAISGIEMPGRSRTSSSACLERVPLPRGRPRRPLPPLAARRGVPLPAPRPPGGVGPPPPPPAGARWGGCRRPPAPARGGGGTATAADAVERGGRRFEAVIFVNEGPKLLQARVDLTLLLFQEIGHVPGTVHRAINSSIPASAMPD